MKLIFSGNSVCPSHICPRLNRTYARELRYACANCCAIAYCQGGTELYFDMDQNCQCLKSENFHDSQTLYGRRRSAAMKRGDKGFPGSINGKR